MSHGDTGDVRNRIMEARSAFERHTKIARAGPCLRLDASRRQQGNPNYSSSRLSMGM